MRSIGIKANNKIELFIQINSKLGRGRSHLLGGEAELMNVKVIVGPKCFCTRMMDRRKNANLYGAALYQLYQL